MTERLEGDAAFAIIDRVSHKYTGHPYPLRTTVYEPFREAVRSHLEFGSRVAQQNSHAETEAELHPLRHVLRWEWPASSDQ